MSALEKMQEVWSKSMSRDDGFVVGKGTHGDSAALKQVRGPCQAGVELLSAAKSKRGEIE
jgi:hypothetical protein